MTFPVWTFGLLMISLTGAHELNHFPENFAVANRNENYTLTCNSKPDDIVTWKLNGDPLEDEENVELNGQNLTVSDIGTPNLGDYSCWRGEEMLSSTYLLLKADEEDTIDSPINCRAKSYDCNFNCTWTGKGYTAVRLGLGHNCSKSSESCQWISSSRRLAEGELQFEMSHNLSPYAEESTMLELTAEAIREQSVFRTSKRFYLRDIVQPDSPQIVKCELVNEDVNVTIAPPSTWSAPYSFFSLEHQIEYVLRDDGQTGHSSSTLIPKKISKLRVRSRDSLVLSNWSQWTPWKNVTY
ncbi:interleukin-12 subunit beta [Astatotilapia calliptera]|uniref:interleukin-12 subunit beta n=1 Tax=Astatotilapia calliptera TaxID=8154 RepID=UPI000E41D6AB|nr:interleukin-12 subunit beta-like [Astatotilapia calliptera]